MRLDQQEARALRRATRGLSEVHLFGSRTDPAARGGDIDILVYSKEPPLELAQRIGREFFLLCEQKLDVVVLDPDNLSAEQAAFLASLTLERFR
ncbi:MAG: DNA polymerase III subunit beta [Gemmatimonadetes bacterium]|nr:DNA polymerase III subunit beta [Gemmatimonadota bacterium]